MESDLIAALRSCRIAGAGIDVVHDAFLGSGTTVIAAERVGRCCYGLELDPRYVDTISRRWQVFTRDHARHGKSGQLFSECEAKKGKRDGG